MTCWPLVDWTLDDGEWRRWPTVDDNDKGIPDTTISTPPRPQGSVSTPDASSSPRYSKNSEFRSPSPLTFMFGFGEILDDSCMLVCWYADSLTFWQRFCCNLTVFWTDHPYLHRANFFFCQTQSTNRGCQCVVKRMLILDKMAACLRKKKDKMAACTLKCMLCNCIISQFPKAK
jgi:hypothetical protein